MGNEARATNQRRLSAIEAVVNTRTEVSIAAANLRNQLLDTTAHDKQPSMSTESDEHKADAAFANRRPLEQLVDDKSMAEVTREAHNDWLQARDKLLTLVQQDRTDEARLYFVQEFMSLHHKYNAALDAILNQEIARMGSLATAAQREESTARLLIDGLAGATVLLAIGGAVLVSRSVSSGLSAAETAVRQMAQGDLSSPLKTTPKGVTANLMTWVHELQGLLGSVLTILRTGADEIDRLVQDMAKDHEALTVHAGMQTSALAAAERRVKELTLTSMRELKSMRLAGLLAASGSDVKALGGTSVDQLVRTITAINLACNTLIIRTMDEIVTKSSALALHATEEATRADGEEHALSTLASEARELAQLSASASQEIKRLLEDFILDANKGSEIAMQAGSAVADMESSVRSVSVFMADMNAAIQARSTAIDQVNHTISEMEQLAQRNTSLLAHLTETSEALRVRASLFQRTINVFKWRPQSPSAPQAVAAPPARPSTVPIVKKRSLAPSVLQRSSTMFTDNPAWKQFGDAPSEPSVASPSQTNPAAQDPQR